MRNLRNIGCHAHTAPASSRITACCWDVSRNEVIVAYGPTPGGARIEVGRISQHVYSASELETRIVASWDALQTGVKDGEDVIRCLHHSSDTLTTCVVMAGGDILTVREDDYGRPDTSAARVEIVGSFDAGIKAARWSPDEEILVITSQDDKMVFMTRSFDIITEITKASEDLKLSKHVSVGWGKKETQFQGKGAKAKALRDPTIPEQTDVGRPSEHDDDRHTISWRGDGAYVAVNSGQKNGRRAIRIYSREGELEAVTEPVDGLEGSLSWRPEGNLLASIRRRDGCIDVVFFERNGLRHGEFTIRLPNDSAPATEYMALEWNSDSTVLAVRLSDRVQLWTMGNYHWYLKQEIRFAPRQKQTHADAPILSWHAEKPLRLVVATTDRLFLNEYASTVARASTAVPHDYGAVAVVDGGTVKFTPFRSVNMPPPYALCDIEVESSVIDVAFSRDSSSMAVLHHTGVTYYALETKGPRLLPRYLESVRFRHEASDIAECVPLQIAFSKGRKGREVLVLQLAENLTIRSHDLDAPDEGLGAWCKTAPGAIRSIHVTDEKSLHGPIAEDSSGRLLRFSDGDFLPLHIKFPAFLPWPVLVTYQDQALAFGLSDNGHLFANSRQLVKNCTSFLVTDSHLIFTTNNHMVKFVHMAAAEALIIPPDDPEHDERCRSIERGARLVTAVPSKMSIILQMPRGNLETVFPRAMVLAGIRNLIESRNYGAAFLACRTHRVDMNILHDYDPSQFMASVDLLIDHLQDAAHIDLFLSTLKEEDVTQTKYRDTRLLPSRTAPDMVLSRSSKINTICEAVLQRLAAQKKANLRNIITAQVCKNPPALEDGLHVVAELMQDDARLAELAVQHICFLVDVNQLYDHALGLYNLDLTLLVAQQSQRDPREYIPLIEELHQMPLLRRQHVIDDKLGRLDKALGHLKALEKFEEAKAYTIRHRLYKQALALYRHEKRQQDILSGLYAAYLKSQSQYRDAGLVHESLGHFSEATDCYRKSGTTCWRECLFSAYRQDPPLSDEKREEIASALAESLVEIKDYASAAVIYSDHLSSLELAIHCLCKGYLFNDVLRLTALHRRPDLLSSTVDPGLVEAFSSSTEFLADCQSQLQAQVPRIAELRRKAVEDPLSFFEGDIGRAAIDIPDDVSIAASSRASTSASLFTRYTGKQGSVGTLGSNVSRATSKNRKREEKKRARGRKGTVYEEEYLVNSVRRLVERMNATVADVEALVVGLVRRGMPERAGAIEALMARVVATCRLAVQEVWSAGDADVAGEAGHENDVYRPTAGGDAVLYDTLEAMKIKQEPPLVKGFGRLTVLGTS